MAASSFSSRQRRPLSIAPFFKGLAAIFALAALTYIIGLVESEGRTEWHASSLDKRSLTIKDQECRLVHTARDKCEFIKVNCPDEEAGLLSYLSLYYCALSKTKPIAFIILALWMSMLFATIGIAASDFFCVNLSTIAAMLGMSESLAGVTLLAFGNGSADVFSTFAAMSTHSGSLAVGELIGAAGFITAVVAGSMALVRPFKVSKRTFPRDVGFFAVAASFSMVFIADGHLHLWECIVMIAFYVFYVLFVVAWDWWTNRRRAQRHRVAAARHHFHDQSRDEGGEANGYHDDEDEDRVTGERTSLLRRGSSEDFGALERAGGTEYDEADEDEDKIARERYLSDLMNMRVNRRPQGSRRTTAIRPSLVGALEFQAVLSSLQKSRNLQTIPINLRRYSDDPAYGLGHASSASVPVLAVDYDEDAQEVDSNALLRVPGDSDQSSTGSRQRAVSASAATTLRLDTSQLAPPLPPNIDLSAPTPPPAALSKQLPEERPGRSPSPGFSITPPPSHGRRTPSPRPQQDSDHLAPPGGQSYFPQQHRPSLSLRAGGSSDSPVNSLKMARKKPLPPQSRLNIPSSAVLESTGSSPASPFPPYVDSPATMSSRDRSTSRGPSIRLPPPSLSSDVYQNSDSFLAPPPPPPRWWPRYIPSPRSLSSTLFPTLCTLPSTNLWGKFVSVVAVLPVLILTVTLPVVEPEKDDADDLLRDGGFLPSGGTTPALLPTSVLASPDIQPRGRAPPSNIPSTVATPARTRSDPLPPPDNTAPPQKSWSRWLFIIQLFLAPLFVAAIIYLNSSRASSFLKPALISLVTSLLLLALLLATTSSHNLAPPKRWRTLACTLGFIVSIAWISSIASEVVGVLKAFGVILGISDAILGLTVFAVGNSLGDLVADITVARLGHPVMALAACFGGPMLNILLGIGCGGLYMTLKQGAKHARKHPHSGAKYKPYVIEIGSTLVISGATLMVILIGLLIVVPLNGWRMDRKIGWGLVALWVISTGGNLAVELSGLGGKIS
ncbi:MAG: hypothetical protein M1814_006445 [Vezdaea aestivalis]|nr:MAG: hypothetical protein M1814_006445 [Vezdaea aestivalis]